MEETPGAAEAGALFDELVGVMSLLRSPQGCPWDREQSPETLCRHIIEEAYETVEAIENGDWKHLAEELGDLLLQILFQAQIAAEFNRFNISDVIMEITDKLERRHPHVFGSEKVETSEQVAVNWERIKREKEGKTEGCRIVAGAPGLEAALEIQKHAAKVGFDWSNARDVLDKLAEETGELREAMGRSQEAEEREIGDILFTTVNIARHLGVDPSRALRRTNREFLTRYSYMENEAVRKGTSINKMTLTEMDELWEEAKLRVPESNREER
ncbi:MAG: nucleoside triphosphate pyrophosphohydrolase [Actinobacteria bacterium]|nr:nucleoside triphosphate pyrophosphohydrolase [Actinomycetota bacterium]